MFFCFAEFKNLSPIAITWSYCCFKEVKNIPKSPSVYIPIPFLTTFCCTSSEFKGRLTTTISSAPSGFTALKNLPVSKGVPYVTVSPAMTPFAITNLSP